MKKRSVRAPKAQSLLIVVGALKTHIPSTEPTHTFRESFNGVPNLRYSAETKGIPWIVDIYLGHYYRAQVGGRIGDTFRTIPSLIGYLIHNLGLAPEIGEAPRG